MIHLLDLYLTLPWSERPVELVPTTPNDPDLAVEWPVPGSDLTIHRVVMAVLWTILIMTLCWLPGHMVQRVEAGSGLFKFVNLDKLIHSGIFVVFALLWARVSSSRRRFAWIAFGGVIFAAVTELGQLIPAVGRDATVPDLIADAAGVLIGIVAFPWAEPWLQRIESRLFPESRSNPNLRTRPSDATDKAPWSR
jgi:VanZ like family